MIDFLEWAGSLSGLLGAFLLATHTRVSRYGWLAFLAANVAMIGFALGIGRYGLLVQQIGFMAGDIAHADLAQVVDGGAKPGSTGDMRCTGFETVRQFIVGRAAEADGEDHVAAALIRW